jgi:hypothetical protein
VVLKLLADGVVIADRDLNKRVLRNPYIPGSFSSLNAILILSSLPITFSLSSPLYFLLVPKETAQSQTEFRKHRSLGQD